VSTLPAHLELIVDDVRRAAERDLRRSRRRRARLRMAAVSVVALVFGSAVAAAATDLGYVSLVQRVYPGAHVSNLGDEQQRVLAVIEDGSGVDVVVTDLGVTAGDRAAPAGTAICEWVEPDRALHCSAATGEEVVVPAGTHVYRINPATPTPLPGAERSVMLVPELEMQLVVDPTPVSR